MKRCKWIKSGEALHLAAGLGSPTDLVRKKRGSAERCIHRVVNRLWIWFTFHPLMAEPLKSSSSVTSYGVISNR